VLERLGSAAACLVMLGSLAGCVSDEGILLAVSGDDVATLEFHVATQQGQDYLLDQGKGAGGVSGMRVSVAGRKLRSEPYELLLQAPATGGASKLRVLVLGLRVEDGQERVVSFGVTEPPQPFVAGEVLRRSVALTNVRDGYRVTKYGRCYRVQRRDDVVRLLLSDDRDCDGSDQGKDCDDGDNEVFPGALEVCDGKDNDCDGKKAPALVPCFAMVGDACKAGQRSCNNGTLEGDCKVGGDPVPKLFCASYDGCKAVDPHRCSSAVNPERVSCTLEKKADGNTCGLGEVSLGRPKWTQNCLWVVVDDGGFDVSIVDAGKCNEARLAVKAGVGGASGTVVVEFFADEERRPVWVREYSITLKSSESCSEKASDRLICKD
jgi:hypothetical protein